MFTTIFLLRCWPGNGLPKLLISWPQGRGSCAAEVWPNNSYLENAMFFLPFFSTLWMDHNPLSRVSWAWTCHISHIILLKMLNFFKQAKEKGEEGGIIIYNFDDTALLIAGVDFYLFHRPLVMQIWSLLTKSQFRVSHTQVTGKSVDLLLSYKMLFYCSYRCDGNYATCKGLIYISYITLSLKRALATNLTGKILPMTVEKRLWFVINFKTNITNYKNVSLGIRLKRGICIIK